MLAVAYETPEGPEMPSLVNGLGQDEPKPLFQLVEQLVPAPPAPNLFGLSEFGAQEELPTDVVAMWAVGSALTLGVLSLGVFLAVRAKREQHY
jgi:hypothetical protein